MIVLADTTPINYLILIDAVQLLPSLYPQILIPSEVHRELLRHKAPEAVRNWAMNPPAWCEVRSVASTLNESLLQLDAGDREAILLAMETGIDTMLMDDGAGRREAVRRHLRVTGTVAVLEKAAQRGLIDFRAAIARLDETNFRLSRQVREAFLRRNP